MGNRSSRDDLHSPPLFRTFAGNSAQRLLESTDAPVNAQHLPCAVLFQVVNAGATFIFKDSAGVSNTLKFAAVGAFMLRMAPLTYETGGTAAATDFFTVFWQTLARSG